MVRDEVVGEDAGGELVADGDLCPVPDGDQAQAFIAEFRWGCDCDCGRWS